MSERFSYSNFTGLDERSPEEATLIRRLHIFCNMRWIAVVCIIVAAITAYYILNIRFELVPVFIICGVIAIYNIGVIYQARNFDRLPRGMVVSRIRSLNYQHRTFDFIALTVLLHYTGGIENPFIFLFVLHIVAASVPLPYRTVYGYATFAILAVSLLVTLEYYGVIPHVNLEGYAPPDLYRHSYYVLGVMVALVVTTYSSAYIATAIAGELRKRQRQVSRLQQELLAQKTKQLELATNEINRLDEEKDRFLKFFTMAAHDLKAPLTAIQSFLWLMLKGISGPITDKQKNMLERCNIRINELLILISDLLDIPRIEAGQLLSEMEEFSLRDIIKQIVDEVHGQAVEKGLSISFNPPEDNFMVHGSPTRLKQVVLNLLQNAISYTPAGKVSVILKDKDDQVCVEVADTGVGIPEQDLPHIFEDFFRGSNVKIKGTGLGLSISRRIVEAHGGKIWVESPYDGIQGSRFSFTIPRAKLEKTNKA